MRKAHPVKQSQKAHKSPNLTIRLTDPLRASFDKFSERTGMTQTAICHAVLGAALDDLISGRSVIVNGKIQSSK